MRVCLGLTEIAGNYSRLQRGFDRLGVPCSFLHLYGHKFAYKSEAAASPLIRLHRWASRLREDVPRRRLLLKTLSIVLERGVHGSIFLGALLRHDAFVFSFGTSFYDHRELPLLKLLGKRVIYVFHGTDSRPPYIGGVTVGVHPPDRAGAALIEQAKAIRSRIARIERHADVIVSNPLSAHFFERPVVSSLAVGKSLAILDGDEAAAAGGDEARVPGRIRVLHAPSLPHIKGTAIIRRAIDALKSEGIPLDYVEIKNRPNAEVLSELARCDFVVDQLYADLPMSTIAAEAAYFGKPSIVAGYAWEEIERCCQPEHLPPVCYCAPDEIIDAIRRMALDQSYRDALGKRARDFVCDRFTGEATARRFLRLIENDIPDDWFFSPSGIRYVHGCGLSEEAVRAAVREVLTTGGASALELSTKPDLERRFLEFANWPSGADAAP